MKLNAREQRLLLALGGVVIVLILAVPVWLIVQQNAEIEDENTAARALLAELTTEGPRLKLLAEAQRADLARFRRKTPPLGSFLEAEAKKHGLSLREVTDQPEKAFGRYLRRSVRASIPDVGLTAVVQLLSGIIASPYPVAIDHVQIEHFNPGDVYNLKLGIVTYDREAGTSDADDKEATTKETKK